MIKNTPFFTNFLRKNFVLGKISEGLNEWKNKETVKKNLLADGKNIYGKDKSYPWKA